MASSHTHAHTHANPSSTQISSKDKNSRRPAHVPWLTKSSSRSISFLKILPEDPKFFSKTSMIQLCYGVWINMTTLVTGLAIGFTAVALPEMQRDDSKIKINSNQEAWIVTTLTLCIPLGSLLGGILMDIYGRQPVIVLCGVPVSLGWFFIGLATTLSTFVVGEVFQYFGTVSCGTTVLCCSVIMAHETVTKYWKTQNNSNHGCVVISVGLGMILTAPRAYITEITLPNMRGVVGAMPYFFLSAGFMSVAILVVFVEWKTISYICGFYSITLTVCNWYLPETPHFVLLRSPDKVEESLKNFRSKSYDVGNELEILFDYMDENDIRRLPFREQIVRMFTTASVCKPFAISLAYILLMLCSGCIVVILRSVEILELSNTAIAPNTGSLIIYGIRIVVGIIMSAILFKAKRRVMALLSATGVGCSAIGISIYLHKHVGRHIAPFYIYVAYITFAVLGYYTLPLITMYEILPLQLRGVLSGIIIALMNLIIFGMHNGFPYVCETVGLANMMAIFGGISLLGTIILYYILPETSEVTLQEIEEYYGSKRPTLISSRTIRSDQFMSMMKASSSQAHEGKMIKSSSVKLVPIKSKEHKLNKSLKIVKEEHSQHKISGSNKKDKGPKDKLSDKYKNRNDSKDKISNSGQDIGGSKDEISDRDRDIGRSKDKLYDKDQGSSKIFFYDKDRSGLSNEKSNSYKDQGYSEDNSFDRDRDEGLSKKTISDDADQDSSKNISDRHEVSRSADTTLDINKNQDGLKDDREQESDNAKETPSEIKSSEEDLINKKTDRDEDKNIKKNDESDMK